MACGGCPSDVDVEGGRLWPRADRDIDVGRRNNGLTDALTSAVIDDDTLRTRNLGLGYVGACLGVANVWGPRACLRSTTPPLL